LILTIFISVHQQSFIGFPDLLPFFFSTLRSISISVQLSFSQVPLFFRIQPVCFLKPPLQESVLYYYYCSSPTAQSFLILNCLLLHSFNLVIFKVCHIFLVSLSFTLNKVDSVASKLIEFTCCFPNFFLNYCFLSRTLSKVLDFLSCLNFEKLQIPLSQEPLLKCFFKMLIFP